jgi:hypothetical protein
MMGRQTMSQDAETFRRVRQGEVAEPLSARAHNALMDAARNAEAAGVLPKEGTPFLAATPATSTEIDIQNLTGADLPQFGIAAVNLSAPVFLPATSQPTFAEFPAMQAIAVSLGTNPTPTVVITKEPIGANAFGKAVILGATPCKVNVVNANDGFAAPTTDPTQLTSAGGGSIQILWKEAGTGTKNAVVMLCCAAADPCCCCPPTTSVGTITSMTGTGTVDANGNITGIKPSLGVPPMTTSMVGTGTVSVNGMITGISPSGMAPPIGSRPCPSGTRPVTLGDGTQACASVADLQGLLDAGQVSLRSGGGGIGGPTGGVGGQPLGGFLGNKSLGLRGGSAMLSALQLDGATATNGFALVWDATNKKWAPTDPATFSSGGITQVGTGKKTVQTTTQTIATYVVGASDEILMASGNLQITGTSIGSMTFAVTFTDIHSGAQSLNGSTSYSTGVTSYNALAFGEFLAKAGSTVNIIATISSGSPTYDSTATIFKLR